MDFTIGETNRFEYNNNDAVTRFTDITGGTTNLFDAAGRLWGIDYPSGASENGSVLKRVSS